MLVLEKKDNGYYVCQDNGKIKTLSKKQLDLEEKQYVPCFIGPALF